MDTKSQDRCFGFGFLIWVNADATQGILVFVDYLDVGPTTELLLTVQLGVHVLYFSPQCLSFALVLCRLRKQDVREESLEPLLVALFNLNNCQVMLQDKFVLREDRECL